MRNYRDLAEYDSDDKLLATSSTEDAPVFVNVPVDEYEPQGVNATFTMQESIAGDEEIREVTVRVSWEDRSGTPHDVTVSSEIAYVPPVSSGQNSITYKSNIDFAES